MELCAGGSDGMEVKMKILLVDENSVRAEGLKFSLEKERYSVIVKLNSKEAKEVIEKAKFNLVILDIMLPDGNGMELCKYIKEKINIPVIFLTAKDKEEDVINTVNKTLETFGNIDILINNAQCTNDVHATVENTSIEMVKRCWETGFLGAFMLYIHFCSSYVSR